MRRRQTFPLLCLLSFALFYISVLLTYFSLFVEEKQKKNNPHFRFPFLGFANHGTVTDLHAAFSFIANFIQESVVQKVIIAGREKTGNGDINGFLSRKHRLRMYFKVKYRDQRKKRPLPVHRRCLTMLTMFSGLRTFTQTKIIWQTLN